MIFQMYGYQYQQSKYVTNIQVIFVIGPKIASKTDVIKKIDEPKMNKKNIYY